MEHKDDDDDDDVSFAKWMSSFWGHSWREEERGLRERHRPQDANYRKTSLPCPFPVLSRSVSSDCQPRRHSQDQEFRTQTYKSYHRRSSANGSFKEPLESKGQSHPKVQEFSESFEKQLCIKTQRSVSLGPESRKDKSERERLRLEVRSHKSSGDGRSSAQEKQREACVAPVAEKKA
ncbi:PREDICTED: leukemia NUP98 fusion partner 1 [Chinchilla lanigera]|uniref:Leukemia NUP98 fusion partner 1 n=1 Tax=Chinchilla lanigera TaxID=34839 RepID=A0A8C2VDW9_CHILA|nr:PREDICTED: leukemia NUP98 fusion partner 1 [Chinchilla lanigera]